MLSDRQLFRQLIAKTSDTPLNIEIVHASGSWMFGPGKKKYLDLVSGVSVSYLGHHDPDVVAAVKEQADKYLHLMVYGEYIQHPQVRLAELLVDNLPESLSQVYFVNSGSEAVEGAMKLAKRFTGRTEIVAFRNAYHGSSQGALSIMGGECFKNAFRPLLPGIRLLDFNDFSQLEQISRQCACVVVEPIQGEAGIRLPAPGFLKALREKCTEKGALLVFDEIQTAFAHTGPLFAFMHEQVVPDILVLAKGLGCGMPLGAFIASEHLLKSLASNPPLGHITTFGGHPVSCAAGLAGMKKLIAGMNSWNIPGKEAIFRKNLNHPSIREIRGKGLFLAVDLGDSERNIRTVFKAIENGVVSDWFLFNDHSFRISPPLTISEEDILLACDILNRSIEQTGK